MVNVVADSRIMQVVQSFKFLRTFAHEILFRLAVRDCGLSCIVDNFDG